MPTVDSPIPFSESITDMKPENTQTLLSRVTRYYDNRTPTVQNVSGYIKVVSPGAMIKGDHSTPNPWGYLVDEERRLFGTLTSSFPSDPSRFFSETVGQMVNNNTDNARISISNSLKTLAYNTALDRLNEQVRGTLDLTISAAELSSTKRMLAATDGLVRTIEGFNQRKLSVAKKVVREASGRYLEWRYGWQPLLSDIYDAANESLRYVLNKTKTVTATCTLKYPEVYYKDFAIEGFTNRQKVKVDGKHSAKIVLEYDTSDRLDRWGSLNPVSIAWELTPYSFVADWFYDVGNFLRNAETGFLYRKDFLKGYVSELDAQYHYSQFKGTVPNTLAKNVLDVFYSRRRVEFSRSVLTSYPLPRAPSFEARLGAERLLSAAALLSQFLNFQSEKTPRDFSTAASKMRNGRKSGISFYEKRASDLLLKNRLVA